MSGIEATPAWPALSALAIWVATLGFVVFSGHRSTVENHELRERLAAVLPDGAKPDPRESAYSVLVATLERLNEENRTMAERLDSFRVQVWTWQQSADAFERKAEKLGMEIEQVRRESAETIKGALEREQAALAKASGLEGELATEREARQRLELEVAQLRGEVAELRGEVEKKA